MARRSAPRSRSRPFRRTKAFFVANFLLWLAIGAWYLSQPDERQSDIARVVRNAFDSRKEVSAFDVAWDLWQIYAGDDFVPGIAPGERTHIYGGVPATTRPVRLLANAGYLVGYSEVHGTPLWSAYRMWDVGVRGVPARPDSFSVDERTVTRVSPSDYTGSGFDRGHLAPSHGIATRHGTAAQVKTFLMSNIVPQRHPLNAGPWRQLERRISANYPGRFGEIWVIAGPVFGDQPERLSEKVAVPDALFMVIVDEAEGRVRAQGFLFSQDTERDASPADHLTSIDEIERLTGLDFLHELPEDAEALLESRPVRRMW